MLEILRKVSKIFSLVFTPISIVYNILIFTGYYLLLGPHSAIKYFENISKPSVIPILRLYGAKIGENCDIQTGITFHNCNNFNNLRIGNNCHIGKNCFLDLRDQVIIENNVVVSMNVQLITHIDLAKSELNNYFPALSSKIIIRDNCYLGANTTVLMGVCLEERTFIASNSLVNKTTISNSMYAGIPAKKIKSLE